MQFSNALPADLAEFWKHASSAFLFKDVMYGQWGLEILTPAAALSETVKQQSWRPRDFLETDLVAGTFLGDSEVLVVRCDQATDDFGSVIVALPIDRRNEWYQAAPSLSSFLQRFAEAEGDKFWEV